MANQEIRIYTETVGANKVLAVDHYLVRIKKNNMIKFQNDVESLGSDPSDGKAIKIEVFKPAIGSGSMTPATGFCKNDSDNVIEIAPNKHENCKVELVGDFKYTVTARPEYDDYDPIIIVDEPPLTFFFFLIAAAVAIGAAYFVGLKVGLKRSSA